MYYIYSYFFKPLLTLEIGREGQEDAL